MKRLAELSYKSGVVKDETELAGRPRWTDSDKIRFVRGLPQKLGGWIEQSSTTFVGVCRGLLSWLDAGGVARVAIGTNTKLYAREADTNVDITPFETSGSLTNPFTTTNGSAVVTVTHAAHTRLTDDTVHFSGAAAVGGITINGEYLVKTVPSSSTYTIEHSSSASSGASGGGTVSYDYEIHVGFADATEGSGYGVGTYGASTYGTARDSFVLLPPRVWALDQWGQFLVACPRDGGIYEWQLDSSTRAVILANAPVNNFGIFVTAEKHLVALEPDGQKMRLEWSDMDDNTVWSPSDQNTAGGRTLTGGSELLFGLPSRGTNLLFTDASVWSMTFIGGQDVFGFQQEAAGASGIISPRAAVDVDGVVYWMGLNDFYYYDGTVRRIRNSKDIRRFVFDNLLSAQRTKCYAFANTLFSEIWFFYPISTEIGRYVKVNYDDWSWDIGTLVRTAGIDRDVFPNPIMAGADNLLYSHESGVDDAGAAIDCHIKGSPQEVMKGGRFVKISSIIPDFKDLAGVVKMTLFTREYPMDLEMETTVGFVAKVATKVDVRASGRQAALQISSDTVGAFWRHGNPKIEFDIGGTR